MKRLAAFLLLGTMALADAPPPIPQPSAPPSSPASQTVTDWAPNEVVETIRQQPGPAFWHVKKGDSEIWILGTVAPLADGTVFEDKHIADKLQGARLLMMPPTGSLGLFSAGWFFLTHRGLLSMPDGKKLEETLPPDLKARFIAARTALKKGPDAYDDDAPVIAAFKLMSHYNREHKLSSNGLSDPLRKLAKAADVKVKSIGDYDALDMTKEVLRLPLESQQKCLAESVAYTEYADAHAKALSEAWAVGDLKGIKAHFGERPLENCTKQVSSFGKFKDHIVADYLKFVHESLSQPGKVVMLADIGALLRNSGVADMLRQEGVTIEGPAE